MRQTGNPKKEPDLPSDLGSKLHLNLTRKWLSLKPLANRKTQDGEVEETGYSHEPGCPHLPALEMGFCDTAFFLWPGSQLVDKVGKKRRLYEVLWGEGERWLKGSEDK